MFLSILSSIWRLKRKLLFLQQARLADRIGWPFEAGDQILPDKTFVFM
jgi:hypothetical protein